MSEDLKLRCPFDPACRHQMIVHFNDAAFGGDELDLDRVVELVYGGCAHVSLAKRIVDAHDLLSVLDPQRKVLFDAILAEAEREIDELAEGLWRDLFPHTEQPESEEIP